MVLNTLKTLISLNSVFIFVTVLHDFDKVFYMQYTRFYRKFRELEIQADTQIVVNGEQKIGG